MKKLGNTTGPQVRVEGVFEGGNSAEIGNRLSRQDAGECARVYSGRKAYLPLAATVAGDRVGEAADKGGCAIRVQGCVLLEGACRPFPSRCEEVARRLVAATGWHVPQYGDNPCVYATALGTLNTCADVVIGRCGGSSWRQESKGEVATAAIRAWTR